MARRVLVLTLLLAMELGCGSTWARSSGVEVPLHRDLMGLDKAPMCTLEPSEWRTRCTRENYDNKVLCPDGCPLAEPQSAPELDEE